MQQVIEYDRGFTNPYTEAYKNALIDDELKFNANTLQRLGFESEESLSQAIEKAMHVCAMNGLNVREHFRCVYLGDGDLHTLCRDWKLSRLAYTLVLLNGQADNPVVGRFQYEMARSYSSES